MRKEVLLHPKERIHIYEPGHIYIQIRRLDWFFLVRKVMHFRTKGPTPLSATLHPIKPNVTAYHTGTQ